MTADVLVLRAQRDRVDSRRIRESAQRKADQVRAIAERIKQMTEVYVEREQGKRV